MVDGSPNPVLIFFHSGKVNVQYASSTTSYFYDLVKPGTLGVPKRISRDNGIQPFKIHNIGTVPGKPRRM